LRRSELTRKIWSTTRLSPLKFKRQKEKVGAIFAAKKQGTTAARRFSTAELNARETRGKKATRKFAESETRKNGRNLQYLGQILRFLGV